MAFHLYLGISAVACSILADISQSTRPYSLISHAKHSENPPTPLLTQRHRRSGLRNAYCHNSNESVASSQRNQILKGKEDHDKPSRRPNSDDRSTEKVNLPSQRFTSTISYLWSVSSIWQTLSVLTHPHQNTIRPLFL
mgnify:CR=1 FL=1